MMGEVLVWCYSAIPQFNIAQSPAITSNHKQSQVAIAIPLCAWRESPWVNLILFFAHRILHTLIHPMLLGLKFQLQLILPKATAKNELSLWVQLRDFFCWWASAGWLSFATPKIQRVSVGIFDRLHAWSCRENPISNLWIVHTFTL